MDYLPSDAIIVVDESHQTYPQVRGMFAGDQARKRTLVEHGFRLPSALDNRPLSFDEWEERVGQAVSVSATPGPYELEATGGVVVEQIIRPTGLLDPEVEVRPAGDQVDDLLGEIRETVARGERVLVTTLTKRMAEDLSEYYHELGVRCRYLHSDIDTLERVQVLRSLRLGEFDVLIGINLAARGARSSRGVAGGHPRRGSGGGTSVQRGRSSRPWAGRPGTSVGALCSTPTTRRARWRGRSPRPDGGGLCSRSTTKSTGSFRRTVVKEVSEAFAPASAGKEAAEEVDWDRAMGLFELPPEDPEVREREMTRLRKEMKKAARELEFERAARLRDHLRELQHNALLR